MWSFAVIWEIFIQAVTCIGPHHPPGPSRFGREDGRHSHNDGM
jgi:hypothetical protein